MKKLTFTITEQESHAMADAVGVMREAAQKLHGRKRLEGELKGYARVLDKLSTRTGHCFVQIANYEKLRRTLRDPNMRQMNLDRLMEKILGRKR